MIVRGSIIMLRLMLITSAICATSSAASVQFKEQRELTISECAARGGECDESRGRPVCGTDDQTYPSRCHLLRAQCSGHQVSLKYRGPCKACKEAREYALKHRTKNPPKFLPRCKPDGTYAPIQCSMDTGCWCSDLSGKPIQNTTVRIGRPKCREHTKNINMRRSPARHLSTYRNRRTCYYVDRAAFNANLLQVFNTEYVRSGQYQRNIEADGGAGVMKAPAERLVLDWKFADLDVNGNQLLDKTEFRELKKLVKRAVKPRRCGRAFGKFCDVDSDDRLTREEWNSCLSKDGKNSHTADQSRTPHRKVNNIHQSPNSNSDGNSNNNSHKHQQNRHSTTYVNHHHRNIIHNSPHSHHSIVTSNTNANNNNNNRHTSAQHGHLDVLESESAGDHSDSSQHLDYEYDYDSEDGDDDDKLSMLHTFGSSSNFPSSILFLRPKPDSPLKSTLKESDSESDCLADQAAALEGQKHGGTTFYVPECTPDGRYQRVQCYRSTPYCWCVHEDTGKNIPGTSMKYKRPQCDAVHAAARPMDGCPETKKLTFLKDLKEFLKVQIIGNTNGGANTTKWSNEDERIATLSFVLLDKNKNKSWERKEWKIFRELMINTKSLRKCGKKLPRYCDVNSDKKITLSEWLNCLQTPRTEMQHTTQINNESVTHKPSKLVGSNPLEQYLKD